MGDPLLLQRAAEVTATRYARAACADRDMQDTMHAANGAGLAAPQIGVSQRVVIFGFERNERYPDAPAGAPAPC